MRSASARTAKKTARPATQRGIPVIPESGDAQVEAGGRRVALTNLSKVFWKDERITKGDLLRYYASVSPYLLPHLLNRAMVMKRYPNGADGEFFFMKRAPSYKPEWIRTCRIRHASGNVIAFPVVDDLASLLWIVNLGCIDLNQWYGRCDAVSKPDYLHFDLDPVPGADFDAVLEAANYVHDALSGLGMKPLAKSSGSRGIHLYVPIERGPEQKEVWEVAKRIALILARERPKLLTAEYRKAKRPRGRVLVDYNQNAWGRTLASVYSVRPKPNASVSAPVTRDELRRGFAIEDFTIHTILPRLRRHGDLWSPLLADRGRFELGSVQ